MKTTKLLTVMILALCIVLALSACDLNITGDINGTLNDSTSTKDPENAPVQDPTEDDKTKDEPTKDNQTKDEPVYDDELCEDGKEHIDVNEDNFCDKCGKEAFAYTQPEHPNFDNNASDPGMSEHEHCDNDCDAICDRCGMDLNDYERPSGSNPITHEHRDKDGDGHCDECGYMPDDYDGETDHEHFDKDGDGYCDKCGRETDNYIGPHDHEHYDKDGDKRCEVCGEKTDNYIGPDTPLIPNFPIDPELPETDHIHFDNDRDAICDECKKPMKENEGNNPSYPGANDGHAHLDLNADTLCDTCKEPMSGFIPPKDDLLQFDNPHLEYTDFVYTGVSITLPNIIGIPNGCTVYMYPDELIEDAGTYEVQFTVEHPDYETYTFTEVLTVHKADYDMSRVEFLDAAFDFDGNPKEICVGGTIPHGLEVVYTGNGVIDSGTHYVTAHFIGDDKNYNPVPDMTAKIVIGPHYTVSFDTGIANIEMEPLKVGIGGYCSYEWLPNIYGYDFVGWELNGEEWYASEPINSDITVTAKWQIVEYKIIYFTNGGDNSPNNPLTYSIETLDVTLEGATRAGMAFAGWYLDEEFTQPITKITDLSLTHFAVYAKWVNPYLYSIEDGKVTITGLDEPHEHLVIPETIEDYPVVAIANDAFCYQNVIKTVYIPDSVTYIGDGVFTSCSAMTTLRLPSNLEYFGSGNFYSCYALEYTAEEDCGAKYLGNETNPHLALAYFYGKDLIIHEDTKIIVNEFIGGTNNSFDKIVIPDSVEFICNYAFIGIGVKELVIGNNVRYIGDGAFSEVTGLKSVVIPDSVTTIGYYAFSNCPDLEEVTLYDSIETIQRYAFSGCPNLVFNGYDNAIYLGNDDNPYVLLYSAAAKDITACNIHPDTQIIQARAFESCTMLTEIYIPESVRYIGDMAFYNCESLTSVVIPRNVTEIFRDTFYGCRALANVTLHSGITFIHDDAFESVYYYLTIDFYGTEAEFEALAGDWYMDWWVVTYK